MATIKELLPYLEKGYALRSVRGEQLRLVGANKVEWLKSKGYRFEPEVYSLGQLSSMSDMWAWGLPVVQGKHVVLLETIAEIEAALGDGEPHE